MLTICRYEGEVVVIRDGDEHLWIKTIKFDNKLQPEVIRNDNFDLITKNSYGMNFFKRDKKYHVDIRIKESSHIYRGYNTNKMLVVLSYSISAPREVIIDRWEVYVKKNNGTYVKPTKLFLSNEEIMKAYAEQLAKENL